jgi:hypothetical protein
MRRVLAAPAEKSGDADGSQLVESQTTDARDCGARHDLRSQRCREHPGNDVGVDSEVDEQAPIDDTDETRDVHLVVLRRVRRNTIWSGHTAERNPPTHSATRSATTE